MRILIDMNLSPRWADILSKHNIEALHCSGIGSADASDAEIMAHAKANDYAIFTHDLDFSTVLAIIGRGRIFNYTNDISLYDRSCHEQQADADLRYNGGRDH